MSLKSDKKKDPGSARPHRHYDKAFIQEIVEAIENGVLRSSIVQEHGICRSVLSGWMREYGSQAYHASKQGRLSLVERRSIVRAVEEGRMTVEEAKLGYNISSIRSIIQWLRDSKREKEELVSSNGSIMAKREDNRQPDPDAGKMTLEEALKALEEEKLKVRGLNTLIDIAEESLKISIRKKPGARQS
jgi:transposase